MDPQAMLRIRGRLQSIENELVAAGFDESSSPPTPERSSGARWSER
jgi:hypothetical protein